MKTEQMMMEQPTQNEGWASEEAENEWRSSQNVQRKKQLEKSNLMNARSS